MNLGDLPDLWRHEAATLRELSCDPDSPAARLSERHAAQLTQALRDIREDSLNLTEAAKVSGYSADHLGALVRAGKLPNAGRANAPRIRRADLPIKNGTRGRPHKPQTNQPTEVTRIATKLRGQTR